MHALTHTMEQAIERPDAVAISGRIHDVRLETVDDGQRDAGMIELDILQTIIGSYTSGTRIPFTRAHDPAARFRERRFNGWNALDLTLGRPLIVVCAPTSAGQCEAIAAEQPSSDECDESCLAAQLSTAFRIERTVARNDAWLRDLESALVAGGMLRRYVLRLLMQRVAVPRPQAFGVIAGAVGKLGTSFDDALELTSELTSSPVFDSDHGDDEINGEIVAILATGLARDPDPQRRARWITLLRAVLVPTFADDADKDHRIRQALLAKVPRATRVEDDVLIKAHARAHPEDLSPELAKAWATSLE
jgi:hypothetical protein